uniref:Uncharacterized protein n=1 Tax=Phaeomonas parva TaxID=124430 RepID=A0A7S1U447_9STRA|mmetsp:Transcript_30524/g.97409  ORF Transcript_30524/g.97409 Transcript_30524/m.97409 type:complete len:344 (+) Transcript_30524:71-1102(+)
MLRHGAGRAQALRCLAQRPAVQLSSWNRARAKIWGRWWFEEIQSLALFGVGVAAVAYGYRLSQQADRELQTAEVLAARAISLNRRGEKHGAAEAMAEAIPHARGHAAPEDVFRVAMRAGDLWAELASDGGVEAHENEDGEEVEAITAQDCAQRAVRCFRDAQRGMSPTGETTPGGEVYLENARRRVVALDRMGQVRQDHLGARVAAAGHYLYAVMVAVNALNPAADVKQSALADDAEGSDFTTQGTTGIPPTVILSWDLQGMLEPPETLQAAVAASPKCQELAEVLSGVLYNCGVNFAEMGQQDLAIMALRRSVEAAELSGGRVKPELVARAEGVLRDCRGRS